MSLELLNSLPESTDWASPQEGSGGLSQVFDLVAEAHVSAGLTTDGEEDFPLGDGCEVQGAPGNADCEHCPVGLPGPRRTGARACRQPNACNPQTVGSIGGARLRHL